MSVSHECKSGHHVHAWCWSRSEGVESPEIGVTGEFFLAPCGIWEQNPGPLQKATGALNCWTDSPAPIQLLMLLIPDESHLRVRAQILTPPPASALLLFSVFLIHLYRLYFHDWPWHLSVSQLLLSCVRGVSFQKTKQNTKTVRTCPDHIYSTKSFTSWFCLPLGQQEMETREQLSSTHGKVASPGHWRLPESTVHPIHVLYLPVLLWI